ncbi:hypothetical protein DTO282F9_825 [Paecilomyces variotii]|nr:hypothetical protein DTO027B9_7594 [Paecilomyces variotii]KAJ9402061.1 hypothetical protein DTO282F9_825 [Paecilomyces variotii]
MMALGESQYPQAPDDRSGNWRESMDEKEPEQPLLTVPGNSVHDTEHGPTGCVQWQRRSWGHWLTILNISVWLVTILFIFSPFASRACLRHLSDQEKWKAVSYYAPVFDRFEIPRIVQTTNGSLYDTYPPSILRVPKGPEADAEWFRIGTGVFPLIISSTEIRKLGKDPSVAVKIPPEHGYGDDAYLAQTEVFHLLHCLDMLRKEISYEHYYFPKFGNNPDAQHQAHIGHCIDLLAQSIKCSSSVDVILFNWVEGWNQPFPDFKNRHVCRDFEALLDYVNDHSVPVEVFQAMKEPPEGYVRLPEPAPVKSEGA